MFLVLVEDLKNSSLVTTDFSNASRPIKDEEKAKLEAAGIDYTEFKIANDGLSVVVSKDNTWVEDLTVEDLKKMWIEDGTLKNGLTLTQNGQQKKSSSTHLVQIQEHMTTLMK